MSIEKRTLKREKHRALLRETKKELIDRIERLQQENRELRSYAGPASPVLEHSSLSSAVLEASFFEIFVIDAASRNFIYANKRARENLGYTMDELLSLRLFDVKKDYDEEHFDKILEPLLSGVLEELEYCTYNLRKDGSSYPVEVHLHSSTYNQAPVYVTLSLDVSEHRNAEDKLKETLTRLEKIYRYEAAIGIVTRTVHKSTDLKSVMENAVQALGRNMEAAEKVSIFLVEGGEAVMYAQRGYPERFAENVRRLQFPSGSTWRAVIQGKTVYVHDVDAEALTAPGGDGRELGKKSYVAIPLKDENRVVGVINVSSTTRNAFGADELRALDIVSKQIEIAINRARFTESLIVSEKALEEKIEILSKKERYEKIVNTIAGSVHSSVDLQEVLDLVVKNTRQNIKNADMLAVYFAEGNEAVMKASFGHPDWLNEKVRTIPYPKGLTWKTIAGGRTNYVRNTDQDRAIGPAGRRAGIKCYISIPLKSRGVTTGCITIGSYEENAFTKEEVSLLEAVANQIETALLNARYVEEIKSNEKRLKALVGSVDEIVFEFDGNGTYLGIWTENEELLIRPREALLGRRVYDFLDKAEADRHVSAIRRVIKNRKSEIFEYTAKLKNGERCFRASINPIIQSNKEPKTVSVLSRDVTESKELESMLLRAQRLESVGVLAGGIAHDLNNVFQPIMLSVQLLGRRANDEKAEKWLGMIEDSARRGSDLIKQILSFARGLESKKQPFEIKYLIKDVEKILKETFPRSIDINIDIKDDIPTVTADYTQLNQVLMNLCLNARDAMPEGGKLSVTADAVGRNDKDVPGFLNPRRGEFLAIKVTDTGTGIPHEVMEHIFDPFFTTKEPDKGTGLGLSTIYGIVKEHDGFIDVDSRMGEGTTFTVYIPFTEHSRNGGSSDEKSSAPPEGSGETILIVDDEKMITDLARTILEGHGYRVLTARNGAEAADVFRMHKDEICAAVVDMMMPVMGGKATIRNLKSTSPSLKIIAVSGHQQEHVLSDVPADAFLPKPFNAPTLLQTLSDVIH